MTEKSDVSICVELWGEVFTDLHSIYAAAPKIGRMSEGCFRGRIRKRINLMGYVTEDFVLHALYSGNREYEGGGGIYLIRQKSSGLFYIGRSICPEDRIEAHKRYYHRGSCRLQMEMQKAGLADFEFIVVVQGEIKRSELIRTERILIKNMNTLWPNGLNSH